MRPAGTVLCAAFAAGALGVSALGQTVWDENFDDYTAGEPVIGQDCPPFCSGGASWQSWDNDPNFGCSEVDDSQSTSGENSVAVIGDGGSCGTDDDDLVRTYRDLGLTTGVYAFVAQQFVPGSAETGATWFNLMNTYPAGANPDWSMATTFNAATNTVTSWDGSELPLIKGRFVEIRVIINLDTDQQDIFYNGELLVSKTWTGGVAEGGQLRIDAIDLYGGEAGWTAYYDDISITEIDPIGACCHDDGSCDEGVLEQDCEAIEDGFFLGIGSPCGEENANCDVRGPDGWIVDAPLDWDGVESRAIGRFDECDIIGGNDDEWVVTIPWPQEWFFNACDFDGADGFMVIGTSKCDDSIAENDDNPEECGAGSLASAIRVELPASGDAPVYVTIENPDEANPEFTFGITAQCPRLAETPGAEVEDEPCGDDTNGGCNMDVPAFIDLGTCDDTPVTVRGTHWFDGAARDTDWYEFTVSEDTEITITGQSVYVGAVFGVIEDSDLQDCEAVTAVNPFATTDGCLSDPRTATVTTTLANTDRDGGDPDTTVWWLFSAPSFGGPLQACSDTDPDGQNGFTFTLECGGGAPCPWDFDASGDVGFNDLVTLLANWGPCPAEGECPWDFDGSEDVGFNDLVTLLANWGPCP